MSAGGWKIKPTLGELDLMASRPISNSIYPLAKLTNIYLFFIRNILMIFGLH